MCPSRRGRTRSLDHDARGPGVDAVVSPRRVHRRCRIRSLVQTGRGDQFDLGTRCRFDGVQPTRFWEHGRELRSPEFACRALQIVVIVDGEPGRDQSASRRVHQFQLDTAFRAGEAVPVVGDQPEILVEGGRSGQVGYAQNDGIEAVESHCQLRGATDALSAVTKRWVNSPTPVM